MTLYVFKVSIKPSYLQSFVGEPLVISLNLLPAPLDCLNLHFCRIYQASAGLGFDCTGCTNMHLFLSAAGSIPGKD